LSAETVTLVTDGLYGVVNEGGTGGRARIPGLDVAGKTGTAQTVSLEGARSARQGGVALKDNGWFVGLAPRRNPEIVVAVLYEGGEHGSLAAPLARDVIKAYFDKKKGILPALPQKQEPRKDVAVSRPAPSPEG
jgi:penicillin-binding protein 2